MSSGWWWCFGCNTVTIHQQLQAGQSSHQPQRNKFQCRGRIQRPWLLPTPPFQHHNALHTIPPSNSQTGMALTGRPPCCRTPGAAAAAAVGGSGSSSSVTARGSLRSPTSFRPPVPHLHNHTTRLAAAAEIEGVTTGSSAPVLNIIPKSAVGGGVCWVGQGPQQRDHGSLTARGQRTGGCTGDHSSC